jgi:NitT/TauT family transport system substrate-binding protein
MHIYRRTLSAILAAALTLAATAAFAATKIDLLYTGAAAIASAYVAKDQGFFTKHGLDVDLTLTANGTTIPAALVSDSAQVGIPTPTVLLQANDAGLDLVMIAGAEQFPTPSRIALFVQPGSDLRKPEDFAGKKIGVPGLNGVIDIMVRQWLAPSGADTKAVYVEVSIPQGPDALRSGQVDAIATIDPFTQRLQSSKTGTMVVDLNTIVPKGAYSVSYVTTRDWANKNPEAAKSFKAALEEANTFAKDPDNLEALRQSIATYTKLPRQIVDTLPLPPNLNAEATPDGMKFWIDVAVARKLIHKAPDPASLVWHG